MRIIIRPLISPHDEVDLTERLVSAIAEELWRLYGGNETLNWLEAERHLAEIVNDARFEARQTVVSSHVTTRPSIDGTAARGDSHTRKQNTRPSRGENRETIPLPRNRSGARTKQAAMA